MELSKNRKEQESKIHEILHKNIILLSHFYPVSKDFKLLLKPNMFIKNNKAAFYETSHYLLNIYDPVLTKEKLKSWPPFDLQREQQFRTEFLNCLLEINSTCDYANITVPMASHLIAPGGFRFARFMLELSEIAMHKHVLQTRGDYVLNCPRATKNENISKAIIMDIKKQTNIINNNTKDMLNNFEKLLKEKTEQALKIAEDIAQLDKVICEAKKEYESTKKEFNTKYPSYPSLESLEEKLNLLKNKSNDVVQLNAIFSDCEKMMNHLKNSEFLLEHKDGDFRTCVDPEIQAVCSRNELDLIEFFRCLRNSLERTSLTLSAPTKTFVEKSNEQVEELTKKYELLSKEYEESMKSLEDFIKKTQKMFDNVLYGQANNTEVPLQPSGQN